MVRKTLEIFHEVFVHELHGNDAQNGETFLSSSGIIPADLMHEDFGNDSQSFVSVFPALLMMGIIPKVFILEEHDCSLNNNAHTGNLNCIIKTNYYCTNLA